MDRYTQDSDHKRYLLTKLKDSDLLCFINKKSSKILGSDSFSQVRTRIREDTQMSKTEKKTQVELTTDQIKEYFLQVGNWKRIAKIIYGEAVGGKKRINYNSGKAYRTSPDKDFMKLYLSYTVGLPTQTSEITLDSKDASKKLTEIIRNDMKLKSKSSVSEDGQISTEQPNVGNVTVDSDKKTV